MRVRVVRMRFLAIFVGHLSIKQIRKYESSNHHGLDQRS